METEGLAAVVRLFGWGYGSIEGYSQTCSELGCHCFVGTDLPITAIFGARCAPSGKDLARILAQREKKLF